MTERSDKTETPEALKKMLTEQTGIIYSNGTVVWSLSEEQTATYQPLTQFSKIFKSLLPGSLIPPQRELLPNPIISHLF